MGTDRIGRVTAGRAVARRDEDERRREREAERRGAGRDPEPPRRGTPAAAEPAPPEATGGRIDLRV
jgi:hypothetical protein